MARATKQQSENERVIGPRKVGGIYFCGYWRETYEVLEINTYDQYPYIEIVERDLDGSTPGRIRRHGTAWDPKRDQVIQEPQG